MATSGTATANLDLLDIIEEAYERAGIEFRNGYDLKTARRSLNILTMEWANEGLNLWTVESGSVSLTSGTATYNLPADTVDILDVSIRSGSGVSQVDYAIERMPFTVYNHIANKNSTGRPTQYMVLRDVSVPTVTIWPVPDDSYTLVYYRMRRIEDAGDYTNTTDVPFRFLPVLIAGLAFHLSMKKPQSRDRTLALKQYYDEIMQKAKYEDRDRSSLYIVPDVS